MELRRTHSIRELVNILTANGVTVSISEDDMDLLDTIYIPSKYPAYSALPRTLPDQEIHLLPSPQKDLW